MKCAACNKVLAADSSVVEYAGHEFCDNLCRYAFKKRTEDGPRAPAAPARRNAPREGEAPAQLLEAPRNPLVTHLFMGAGLVFLLVTRYIVYVQRADPELNVARALGANTAYFMIWGAAYWIARTSPRGNFNGFLGLLATVSAPTTMPVIGLSIVASMYVIKRGQLMKK